MMDVDDFKRFNDSYGHPQGDKVLAVLARVISECVRRGTAPAGTAGRNSWSCSPTPPPLRLRWWRNVFVSGSRPEPSTPDFSHAVHVTVSLGISQLRPDETAAAFVERADAALYQSKTAERTEAPSPVSTTRLTHARSQKLVRS